MHFRYEKWDERFNQAQGSLFDKLFNIFQQLLLISGGDVPQTLKWLTELDREYKLTGEDSNENGYGIGDFVKELQERGFVKYDEDSQQIVITHKTEHSLRKKSLEEIFHSLKKGGTGSHKSNYSGKGQEREPETRPWQFGDEIQHMEGVGSLMNALKHSNLDDLHLEENDLLVHETDHYTSIATALLIDLSHSMILYGEDRITPAKKVAMALAEMILNQYEKDSLDIIAFGNNAWPISIKDLPYLQVGPYHTNTQAALKLARHLLQRRKYSNKQIFMITDGKPSAMFRNGRLFKNSFGLDRRIVNNVLDEAVKCRREKITITTFMIARDPYLQNFVRELTEANFGRAYYASLDNLGDYVFEDYIRNRRKRLR